MLTLFDRSAREAIHERVERLSAGQARQWGTMQAGQMVFVHWAPWPKARIKAPPEMFTSTPAGWGDDVAALHALIDRAGKKDPTVEWAVHPMFGPVSSQEWRMLCWKHLDHHLRQFGA